MTPKNENPAGGGASSVTYETNGKPISQENQDISSNVQEIEQDFLGAIIASDDAFYKSRRLQAEDFSVPVHGEIYGCIARRYEEKAPVTAQLLAMDFSIHPDLASVGGGRYVIDIANGIVSTMAAPECAEQIYKYSLGLSHNNEMEIVCMEDIKMEKIEWLWPERIARGKLAVIAGNPGLGKSQIMASLAAIISKGLEWPDTMEPAPQGNVIILSAEDDVADTIKPRLAAAGADMSRCHVLSAIKIKTKDGKPALRMFDLTQDIARLEVAIQKIGNVKLVTIDPISAYMGATDSHNNAEVRGLLAPLTEMAARHKVAVILVTHFNKSTSQEPIGRVIGSIGTVAAARAGYAVIKNDQKPEIRYLVPLKNNIGDDRMGFSFQIEGRILEGDIKTSRVRWDAGLVDAHKVLYPEKQEKPTATNGAADFLRDLLSVGPMPSNDVYAQAEGMGYGKPTIQRASRKVGIKPKKDGMKGPWMWGLPDLPTEDSEDDAS